jgi:hypothetical protein
MSEGASEPRCRLSDFLRAKYPKLFDAFNNVCQNGALNGKRVAGVALLVPEDEVVDEIDALISSDKDDDVELGIKQLKSLVLYGELANVADFKKADATGIPNADGVKVEIDSVKDNVIKFKNGATAKRSDEFKPMPKMGKPYVVYNLKGKVPVGSVRLDATQAAPKKKVKGGVDPQVNNCLRACYAKEIEQEAINSQSLGVFAREVRLFVYFVAKHKDQKALDNIVYERIIPICHYLTTMTYDLVSDFFRVFEPYTMPAPTGYIIPEDIFNAFYITRRAMNISDSGSITQTIDKLFHATIDGDPALCYKKDGFEQIQTMCKKFGLEVQKLSTVPQKINAILDFYRGVSTTNSIDGKGPIYPEQMYLRYASDLDRLAHEAGYDSETIFDISTTKPSSGSEIKEFLERNRIRCVNII